MITEDEATRMLELADPARSDESADVVDAAGYLATLRTRSSNVTLIDTEPTPTRPDTSHRRYRRPGQPNRSPASSWRGVTPGTARRSGRCSPTTR